MKSSEQALPPSIFREVIDDTTKKVKLKPKNTNEDALVALADSEGWKEVKKIIENKKSSIEAAYMKAVLSSTNMEEIGLRALAKELVTIAYDSVISTVELPYNARKYELEDKEGDKNA